MNKRKGFTLIEMLVSLVILTGIMLLSSEAYRYFVVQLNQRQDTFVSNMQHFKRLKWLQHQISAAEIYYVTNFKGGRQALFTGNNDSMLWVSATSVSKPGTGALSSLNVTDNTLSYCEQTLSSMLLLKDELSHQDLCKNFQLDIMAVSNIKLTYFGWSDINAQLALQNVPGINMVNSKPSWHSSYKGAETGTLPSVVKIIITTVDKQQKELWIQLYGINPAKTGYFNNAPSN